MSAAGTVTVGTGVDGYMSFNCPSSWTEIVARLGLFWAETAAAAAVELDSDGEVGEAPPLMCGDLYFG